VLDANPFDFESPRTALVALIDWKISSLYQPYGFQKFSLAGPSLRATKPGSEHLLNIPDLTHVQMNASSAHSNEGGEDVMEIVHPCPEQIQSQQIVSLACLVQELSSMLLHLGHHLSASPELLTKLCRLLKVRLESLDVSKFDATQASLELETVEATDNEVLNIYRITSSVLLPSLSRIDCNPAVSALCWSIISLFPFNARFTMYGIWKGDGLGKQVCLSVYPPLLSLFLILTRASDQSHWKSSMPKRRLYKGRRLA
jgi:hypothetical protein